MTLERTIFAVRPCFWPGAFTPVLLLSPQRRWHARYLGAAFYQVPARALRPVAFVAHHLAAADDHGLPSGLAVILFDPPAMTLSWMTTIIIGLTVASGTMFYLQLYRTGAHASHSSPRTAVLPRWAMFLSTFHAAFPYVSALIQSTVYTAAFAPGRSSFSSLRSQMRCGAKARAAKFRRWAMYP